MLQGQSAQHSPSQALVGSFEQAPKWRVPLLQLGPWVQMSGSWGVLCLCPGREKRQDGLKPVFSC